MTTTPRGAGRIDKVWCEEAADIDPAAWAALGKPRGTGPVYTVCHDDLVGLPEMNLAQRMIPSQYAQTRLPKDYLAAQMQKHPELFLLPTPAFKKRKGFTTTPPDRARVGMKGLLRNGYEATLKGINPYQLNGSEADFMPLYSLRWVSEHGEPCTTTPLGRFWQFDLAPQDIVQWEILNPETE